MRLLEELHAWKPSDQIFESQYPLCACIEELWVLLYERGYIQIGDINLMHAWLQSLIYAGYKFPVMVKRNFNSELQPVKIEVTGTAPPVVTDNAVVVITNSTATVTLDIAAVVTTDSTAATPPTVNTISVTTVTPPAVTVTPPVVTAGRKTTEKKVAKNKSTQSVKSDSTTTQSEVKSEEETEESTIENTENTLRGNSADGSLISMYSKADGEEIENTDEVAAIPIRNGVKRKGMRPYKGV
jgi:hypothetical protein